MRKYNFAVETSAVQIKLKREIVNGIMANKARYETLGSLRGIIDEYVQKIKDATLRREFKSILIKSAEKIYDKFYAEYSQIGTDYGLSALFITGIFRNEDKAEKTANQSGQPNGEQIAAVFESIKRNKNDGVSEDYTEYIFTDKIPVADIQNKIKRAIFKLAQEDAEKGDGHNLRSRAEMLVRYEAQRQSVEDMRASGVQLVWCSTHGDCSKRCAPYQGRLYSLNHKSGEIDGHKYVPLEAATDNPNDRYVTRSGKAYQNGLFGFNCRHRLIPYNSHQTPPKSFTPEQMREMRRVDCEQRHMELEIRNVKAKAWICKGQNGDLSAELFKEARRKTEAYRRFCRVHNRVALIWRTQVMAEEL